MSVLGRRSAQDLDADCSSTSASKKRRISNESDHNDDLQLDDDLAYSSNQEIILNVGGIKYFTTIQPLTGFESMLKARFSSRYAMKASVDGSYFIDRDGELFKYILKYLRTGKLILPKTWSKEEIYSFYQEIKYFAISSLLNVVPFKLLDSEILTHRDLKAIVINKIRKKLNCSDEDMDSLNGWKLVHRYNVLTDGVGLRPQAKI